MLFEDFGDDGRLLPRGTTVRGGVDGNVVVLVAVDFGCRMLDSSCITRLIQRRICRLERRTINVVV